MEDALPGEPWSLRPVIPVLQKQRQEGQEFSVILGYSVFGGQTEMYETVSKKKKNVFQRGPIGLWWLMLRQGACEFMASLGHRIAHTYTHKHNTM